MSTGKIRLMVSTNTNIRFLTALPSEITIAKSLPIFLNKYRTVIRQNLGEHHELLDGSWIAQVTLRGCLIGREEVLSEVFTDGCEVQLKIEQRGDQHDRTSQIVAELSKRQKLQTKKHDKKESEKPESVPPKNESSNLLAKSNSKPEKPQKVESGQKPTENKEQEVKVSEMALKLLNKFRKEQKPVASKNPSKTKIIVAEEESS